MGHLVKLLIVRHFRIRMQYHVWLLGVSWCLAWCLPSALHELEVDSGYCLVWGSVSLELTCLFKQRSLHFFVLLWGGHGVLARWESRFRFLISRLLPMLSGGHVALLLRVIWHLVLGDVVGLRFLEEELPLHVHVMGGDSLAHGLELILGFCLVHILVLGLWVPSEDLFWQLAQINVIQWFRSLFLSFGKAVLHVQVDFFSFLFYHHFNVGLCTFLIFVVTE